MKHISVLRILCIFGIIAGISVYSLSLSNASGTTKEAVSKSSISMPVLKGDVWQRMTNDEKVSFMWGAGHVINIEEELMNEIKDLKRDSFVTKAYEGMSGMSMQEIVNRLDDFYKKNPDKIEMPVFDVIWDQMITPKIKSGIAGRPLEQ